MYTLRDYQQRSVDGTFDWMQTNPKGHPLLVLPTGAGKSLICGQLISNLIDIPYHRPLRILVLTHVKELVEQNAEKFASMRPDVQFGFYSAGIGRKDCNTQVLFASIQSIYKDHALIGTFDIAIVDECHLMPKKDSGMYRGFIDAMTAKNPYFKVIGLTATPYRMDGGYLYEGEGRLFTGISAEVTILELLELGFLSNVISPKSAITVDMKGVSKTGGDYNVKQMTAKMMKAGVLDMAMSDVLDKGGDRKSCLIFCGTVEHAESVQEWLSNRGHTAYVITGKTKKTTRPKIIEAFKRNEFKYLINVGVLTTGFDAPIIDLLAILRATDSTSLYMQIVGRGMRILEGKENCMVLDYGGNIAKHGCIDDPIVKVPHKKRPGNARGDMPASKSCPNDKCSLDIPYLAKECHHCGYQYPVNEVINIDYVASRRALLTSQKEPCLIEHDITGVSYTLHQGKDLNKPPVARITYHGNKGAEANWFAGVFSEQVAVDYVPFEGPASFKGLAWWRKWVGRDVMPPQSLREALDRLNQGEASKPDKIVTDESGKYPKIVQFI